MTGWAWHLANGPTLLADLGHTQNRSVTWRLSGPGVASFELDGADPVAALVSELVTDLIVSYDGRRMWRGRVGATSDDLDGTRHRVTVEAVDYRGVLERRLTTGDITMVMSPADKAWEALASIQARPAGDLGISRGTVAAGADRVLSSEWGETIAAIIDRWASLMPGGFDWWIDGNLVFHTANVRGDLVSFGLVYGETVAGVNRNFDPSTYANVIRASGADGVTPAVAEVPDLASRPEGRWESQVGDTELKTAPLVDSFAAGRLLRASTLAPDYTFTLTPGAWTPDKAWIGDIAKIRVRSGRLDVDTVDRITEITVTDNDGVWDAQVGTGSELRRNFALMFKNQAQRLTALARH